MDKNALILLLLVSFIALVSIAVAEPQFIVENSTDIVFWVNETGSINITEDLICPNCINPEDVNDIDKANIETDLNTFVDIAGDTMTNDLTIESATPNLYLNDTTNPANGWGITNYNDLFAVARKSGSLWHNKLTIDSNGNMTLQGNLSMGIGNLTFKDNHKTYYGDSDDACIYWNGTGLVISTIC